MLIYLAMFIGILIATVGTVVNLGGGISLLLVLVGEERASPWTHTVLGVVLCICGSTLIVNGWSIFVDALG